MINLELKSQVQRRCGDFFAVTTMDNDGMSQSNLISYNALEITPEELIASLGNSASFGTLKKLLKQVDEIEVANVR